MKIIITQYNSNAMEIMNITIHTSVKLLFQGAERYKLRTKENKKNFGTRFLVAIKKLLKFPGVPVVRTQHSHTAGSTDLIPGQGSYMLYSLAKKERKKIKAVTLKVWDFNFSFSIYSYLFLSVSP